MKFTHLLNHNIETMKNSILLKISTLLLVITNINFGFSQETNTHKLQMGIVIGESINMYKVDSKLVTNTRVGSDLTVGMNVIKSFTDNLGVATGIEFDFSSIRYKFNDSAFYNYSDNVILQKEVAKNTAAMNEFYVTERQQKPIYITIPTMFLFKTDYIGFNRYFAKFGMRHSFSLKNSVNDKGFANGSTISSENNRMKLKEDLAIYTGSIGISAGTEWNYSGSSSIQFELGYYYGINSIHRGNALFGDSQKNMSLYKTHIGTDLNYTTLKTSKNQIALKVSFLF